MRRLPADLGTSLIVGLCCFLIYNANGRAISAGDAFPARYLPFAIWERFTLTLDPVEALVLQGRARPGTQQVPLGGVAFWTVPTPSGHLVSLYPVVLPVLVAPFYLPAVGYLHLRGWSDERIDRAARIMEKLVASSVAALSAALCYLLLRRRAAPSVALLLTAAYALGTTTWVISSQALWQHGMAQLLLVGLLLLLTAPATTGRALAAGLLCALVTGTRPADAALSAALGVYGLFWAGRAAAAFVAGAAVPAGLVVLYNVTIVGAIGGAYTAVGLAFFGHDVRSGLAGLLLSPTRGLLVFSPFLAFLGLAWRHWPRDSADRRLATAILAGVVAQILIYALTDWRAGFSFGPRFMTDVVPLLVWLLVPVVVALRRVGRVAFVTAVGIAIGIEAIGAFTYDGYTDRAIFAATGADPMRAAWQWRNAPFVAGLSRGLAPPELVLSRRGAIDRIEVAGRAVDAVPAGSEVVVSGWALIGRSAPLQLAVAIDDAPYVATSAFIDRPDIAGMVPGSGRAGWRVPIPTAGLAPGDHRLSVYVWGTEASEAYLLTRGTVTVQATGTSTDLEAAFTTAAGRIRAHQQAAGFWLTAFTSATRFEKPRPEMNTYVTSLLVDLLDPLTAGGLGDSAQRARQHLTAQIEPSGLVRYHGLPDGPGIGTLGCAITPDTDDTALVWRIAPDRDRRRLAPALATIDGYRTPDGLYRTWLAPRDRFQCLDPGRDPNPPDVAIQIHLLQLLAAERPEAGRALCEALRRQIGDDRIWVYYARSPLVPILRLPDLERAGCRIDLPASRLQTTVPGQDIWVSVVKQLARGSGTARTPAEAAEATALLRQLARDDFALVRANPPLLYHNDLTATVSRYYWSEDVGYALWLRLAHDHAHIGRPKPGD